MNAGDADVAESNATINDIQTTFLERSAAPGGANATYAGANALSQQQCPFVDPLPTTTDIPTLSEWALSLLSGLLAFLGAIALLRPRLNGSRT
jgi:hypothetical protein